MQSLWPSTKITIKCCRRWCIPVGKNQRYILLQAEIEIVEELIDHYQEFTEKLQNQATEIQDTLKEQNNKIKETYQDSKKETDLLEQKLGAVQH